MNLSLQTHRTGDVIVITCAGRIVEGGESALLRRHLDELLPGEACIVLDLGEVDFIDSSGLGLLARLAIRMRVSRGDLKLCAIPPAIDHVLTVTRLRSVFDMHPSQAEALAAFSTRPRLSGAEDAVSSDVLCVHRSADVLAFVRTVLKQAGYGVMTADNLADALTLLQGTAPKALLIDSDLRGAKTTTSAARFNDLIGLLPVIEMRSSFSTSDAGAAGRELLAQITAVLGAGAGSPGSV